MRKILVVVMAAGLALAAAARVGPADPVSPQERCAAAERDSATLADIRANLNRDPVAAMTRLGLRIGDFESFAMVLHARWLMELGPAQAPAQTAATGAGWWCFQTADFSWGDCLETKAMCEQQRAALVTRHANPACPPLLSAEQCIDAIANAAGYSVCERHDRVSCFRRRIKLAGDDDLVCGPTIKICKTRRTDIAKNYTDDQIVKSDCAAHE